MNGNAPATEVASAQQHEASTTVTAEASPLDAALAYAQRGWHVMPLGPNKAPWLPDWTNQATTDANTIRSWWAERPDSSVGLHAGRSGLVVVDIDNHGDVTGFDSLAADLDRLRADAGAIVRTRSGGEHLFFAAPEGRDVRRRIALWPGVDLLAGSSNVATVGTPGYSWVKPPTADRLPVVPASIETRAAITKSTEQTDTSAEVWSEGTRDHFMFIELSRQRGNGLGEAALTAHARDLNASRCVPPLPDDQVLAKVAQVMKYEPGDPMLDATARWLRQTDNDGDDPFRPRSWDEMRSMTPPEWLVDGTLPRRGVAYFAGKPAGGKSFLVLDLLLAVAAKRPTWFDREVDSHGRVVYVAMEDWQGISARVGAWLTDAELDQPGDFWAVPEPALDLTRPETIERLLSYLRDDPPLVVAIDTQAKAAGSADENSNTDMGVVLAHAQRISQELDCLVLLVHHTGHSHSGRLRGASSMLGAADAVLVVEDSTLRTSKLKSAPLWDRPESFELQPVAVMVDGEPLLDPKGRQVTSAVVRQVARAPASHDDTVLYLVAQEPGVHSAASLIETHGLADNATRASIRSLIDQGCLVRRQIGRNQVLDLAPDT